MNITFKLMSAIAISCLLTACGGHGFEGTYKAKTNTGLESLFGGGQDSSVVIGEDYIESSGSREEYEEIFVRESGGKKYLIFKSESDASEEAWRIKDDETLIQDLGLFELELKRVN